MRTTQNLSPAISCQESSVGSHALLEGLFPFLWFALYNIVYSVSSAFAESIIPCPWIAPGAVAVYTIFLVRWAAKQDKKQHLSSFFSRIHIGKDLAFLPVLLIQPAYNLALGTQAVPVSSVLLVLEASIIEEIFFRGFLLSFLMKRNIRRAIWTASFVFAAFHAVNLLSGAEGWYVVLQVLCAFSLGICYSAAALRFNSLLPSIAAHGLVNITGLCAPAFPEDAVQMRGFILCGCLQLICGMVFMNRCLFLRRGNDL